MDRHASARFVARSRARALVALLGLVGVAVVALWIRRGLRAYRDEANEFAIDLPADALPEGDAAPPGIREVAWKSEGEELRAWYVPPRNGAVLVYLHGSPGTRAGLLPEARALARYGYGAVLLDLPGYGASGGRRRWDATYLAGVTAALDFAAAQPEVDAARLGVFGFSMGTCIAAQAAARDPRPRALVLRGTFTRLDEQLRAQCRSRFPLIPELATLAATRAGLNVRAMDTESAFHSLGDRSVLLIAGAEDTGVPPSHSERLHAIARNSELWIVPGMGHLGFAEQLGEPYYEKIRRFLDRALAPPSEPDHGK